MDTIEEVFKRLRGLYGERIEQLWQLYILSNPEEKLENGNFIRTIDISTLRGRIKLFEITEKGQQIITPLGYKPKSWRKGGVEHQYWQYKVAQFFHYKGYKITENYLLGKGKEIDIVVEKDNEKIAIEIETGKSDAYANIQKCLDANVDKILCLTTKPELKIKIREKIQNNNVAVASVKELLHSIRK